MAFLNPKVVITAEDKTRAAFSKLHSGVTKAGDAMRTALKWGAVGFGLLATEAVLAIKAFEAAELASKRLRSSFQGVGGISREAADELEKYANTLQYSTAMADEQIISGMAMLGTFRLTTDQVKQLTPGMLDAAAALEKTTGQAPEMEQLAIQIGKAASTGNIGMLKRWGLSLTEAQEAAFKLADQQGRVNILTQAISENFGGMAAASADSYTGKLRIMRLAIDDLQEGIGKALLEALLPMITAITNWAKSDEGQATIMRITNAIIQFGQAMAKWIIENWPTIQGILKGIWEGFKVIGWVIGDLIRGEKIFRENFTTGLGLIIYWVEWTIRKFQDLWDWLVRVGQKAGEVMRSIGESRLMKRGIFGILPFQFGGYAEAGQPIMVGETGPELFVPSQAGTVKPKGSFGAGGGGGNINIVVNIGMYAGTETEKRRIAEDLLKAVGDRARARNIGLSQYLEVI